MSKTSDPIPSPLYVACQALISRLDDSRSRKRDQTPLHLEWCAGNGAFWHRLCVCLLGGCRSRSALEQRRSVRVDTGGHGTGLASGKQEVIPAFLNKETQVSSPAMPNVVISGFWLAG